MAIKGNYLVYNPHGNKPQKIHHTWDDAWNEAERLAKIELENIYILKIDSIVVPRQEIKTKLMTNIPQLDSLT